MEIVHKLKNSCKIGFKERRIASKMELPATYTLSNGQTITRVDVKNNQIKEASKDSAASQEVPFTSLFNNNDKFSLNNLYFNEKKAPYDNDGEFKYYSILTDGTTVYCDSEGYVRSILSKDEKINLLITRDGTKFKEGVIQISNDDDEVIKFIKLDKNYKIVN